MDKDKKELLQTLARNSEGMIRILNDILDLEKLEKNQKTVINEIFSITDLFDDISLFLSNKPNQNVIYLSSAPPELPVYWLGDLVRVRQIINNLLSNAIKYTQSGKINIDVSEHNSKLKITITDTGNGISEASLINIFNPYIQLNSKFLDSRDGLGLGLSISKEYAKITRRDFNGDFNLRRRKSIYTDLLI